jgi:hypothetical protein
MNRSVMYQDTATYSDSKPLSIPNIVASWGKRGNIGDIVKLAWWAGLLVKLGQLSTDMRGHFRGPLTYEAGDEG